MIKWNEYTWYSKLAAIIFFLAVLPVWTFYIGTQYQSTEDSLNAPMPAEVIAPKTVNQNQGLVRGEYGFWEFAEPDENWSYYMTVTSDPTDPIDLTINGFQTQDHFIATTESSGTSTEVILDSFGSDDNSQGYKKGDVLFSLIPDGQDLDIVWNKLQPQIDTNKTGAVFQNVSDDQ